MTPPAIAPSGDFEEEELAELALAVADGVCDGVCDDGVCDVGGAKRGIMSVVSNENLSSSNSLLPFEAEPKFVTTAVWKVSVKRGVSKYTTSKIAVPFDVWEVTLGGPPSIVN